MKIVKPLLELDETGRPGAGSVFDVVVFGAELLPLHNIGATSTEGSSSSICSPVGFARDIANDGTGKRIFWADPIGDVFAVVVIIRAGELAFDKVQAITNRVLMDQDMALFSSCFFGSPRALVGCLRKVELTRK